MAKDTPFHNPFSKLKQWAKEAQFFTPTECSAKAEAFPPALPSSSLAASYEADEDGLFRQAMLGVENIYQQHGRMIAPTRPAALPDVPVNPDLEVMAHLSELVAGDENMQLSWQKDFVRGSGGQVNSNLLQLLAAGHFPIQDYLDLHGMVVEEAMLALEKFLKQSRERSLRHVLLVHGKGKGSAGGESILKEILCQRLCHKRFARWVLAFCSARPCDGGTGAMYVLLKTWQGPTIFSPLGARGK
jgi:DNA-nicking Smr family endonuclease